MSDALVKKIADVLADDLDDEPEWSRIVIAKHVIEALGLGDEWRTRTWDGRILDINSHGVMTDVKQRRYVTNWEDA